MQGPEQTSSDSVKIQPTELVGRRWLSRGVFELELSRPEHFLFKAGHTLRLIYNNKSRYYSIASAPNDPTLLLCINHIETGEFSPLLASLELKTKIGITGPHGFFTFSESSRTPVFIGTDTGIAPFSSMARSGIKGFTLFQGARYAEEIYYRELFLRTADRYIPFVWGVPTVDFISSSPFKGKMVDLLKMHLQPGKYDFYLCGWQKMIQEVTRMVDRLFPESHVYTEVFYHLTDPHHPDKIHR